MSIIYDALKKVECKGQAQTGPNTPLIKQASPVRRPNFLLIILVVALGFVSANYLFKYFTPLLAGVKPKVAKAKDIPSVTLTQLTPAPDMASAIASSGGATTVLPTKKPENQAKAAALEKLTINGIFFSGEDNYALINNQIVKIGDSISGWKVEGIFMDEVELKSDSGEIVRLHRS